MQSGPRCESRAVFVKRKKYLCNSKSSYKESLLYTVEVGLSSLKYWKENLQDWYSVLNDQMITKTRSQEWINAQGTICDEYFRPQAGVSITIKGTYCGTSTDADGRYGIGVRPNDKIVITLLGYKGVNVAANEYLAGPITTVLEPNDGFPGYLLFIIAADATGAGVQYYSDPRAILCAALLSSLSAAVGYLAQDIIE